MAKPSAPTTGPLERAPSYRTAGLVAGLALVLMLASNLFWRELYTGDEGFYGVTALNMLRSGEYILRPSYFPEGNFLVEQNAFAHPPVNSWLYAATLWVSRGALGGLDVLNVLSFGLLLFFTYRLLGLFDPLAGRLSVVLLAASPVMMRSYAQLEAEPWMTTCGVMSLYCIARSGVNARGRMILFLGGVSMGMAFVFKLWLSGPLGLAVVAALGAWLWREREAWRKAIPGVLLFGLGAVAPAGLHLLLIHLLYPQDLAFWLNSIYFGVFTGSGLTGSKLEGAGVMSEWVHPVWYYAALLYRDHFFLFPLILVGFGSLWRDERVRPGWLWVLFIGLAGIIPLSLMKVKESLYVLSCTLFLYVLASLCLAATIRRMRTVGDVDPWSKRLAGLAVPGLLVLFPIAFALGIQPDKITAGFVAAHTAILAGYIAVFLWARRKPGTGLERIIHGACLVAVVAAFGLHAATVRPRDQTIARIAGPYLQANAVGTLSFIATNFKSYQLLTFHRGMYWHELPLRDGPEAILAAPQFSQVRTFIVGPDDLDRPEMGPWLEWLKTHAVEKTAELDGQLGRASRFRLFVR